MLTIDAVPTPQGDLLVACHSGKPDWGTGPQGKGKLFKISYSDKAAPQPLFAYAASPTETGVVFDRPVDPTRLKNLTRQSGILTGRYVVAGQRFESFRPGYQVVKNQMDAPCRALPVLSAGVTPDNRSIVLQTAARTESVNYAITIPPTVPADLKKPSSSADAGSDHDVDLLCDLTGLETKWVASTGQQTWRGWLPHPDFTVARALTASSVEHNLLFNLLKHPGELTLRCQLDLSSMLHPLTQPGAKLDYEYPPETVTVVLKADADLRLKTSPSATVNTVNSREVHVTIQPKPSDWLPLEVTIQTGPGSAGTIPTGPGSAGIPAGSNGHSEPNLTVSWFTAEDPRPRAMFLRRFLLPWATPNAPPAFAIGSRSVPELAGGDWGRGKKVFFSEQTACFKCHQVAGEGGKLGPDLSSLTQRDYASVLKDITEPSAAINPDHLAYNLELKDGAAANGVILDDTPEKIVLGQATGQSLVIEKSRISSMKASAVSLMPEGLLKTLSAQQQKDLLTFLLTEPLASGGKP